jgi:RHS repeat-associated protein
MTYDAALRLRSIVNPAGEKHTREYDAKGNLVRETTFAGLTREYEHDACDRVVKVKARDGSTAVLERDAQGRLTSCTHASGLTLHYSYDAAGRLLSARRVAANRAVAVDFVRDARGRVVREIQRTGGWTFVVQHERDAAGRVVARRYSTGWNVWLKRDAAGLPLSVRVTDAKGSDGLRFRYDAAGRELTRTREGADQTVVTERNAEGFPTRVRIVHRGEVLRERSYAWSSLGPLSHVVDRDLGTREYALDERGRALRVAGLGAGESYAYSKHGTPVPGPLHGRGGRTAGDGAELLGPGGRPALRGAAALEWDAHGRLAARRGRDASSTWRYEYDAEDQLVCAVRSDGARVDYAYDALGRRVMEACGGVVTYFGWDGDSAVEECVDTPIGRREGAVRRVFADDGYTPLLEAVGDDVRMVVTDAASTPWYYVDREAQSLAAIDLTAHGKVALASGRPGTLRFAGQRAEAATGLHYNRYRHYAPDLGVFVSPDPLGLSGSAQDIAFVPNTTYCVDPMGLRAALLPALELGQAAAGTLGGVAEGSVTSTLGPLLRLADPVLGGHGVPGQALAAVALAAIDPASSIASAALGGALGLARSLVGCSAGSEPFTDLLMEAASLAMDAAPNVWAPGADEGNRVADNYARRTSEGQPPSIV